MSEAKILANLERGSVVAAAGCGKTELIARAIAELDARQLVLTHTNAGVEAINRRLRRLGVPPDRAGVDTIDGWCLKYVSAYPKLTGGVLLEDDGRVAWRDLRLSMCAFLDTRIAKSVLSASYAGALVDEYQDCDDEQHELVTKLAGLLPTRILGDPLQAVFRFRGDPPNWGAKVEPTFPRALSLTVPWRWRKPGANSQLGDWLADVRGVMEARGRIQLADARVETTRLPSAAAWQQTARDACFLAAGREGTVVAICKWPADCHTLARMTGGLFQCVEPIEARDAGAMLHQLEQATEAERPEILMRFVGEVAIGSTEAFAAVRADLTDPASDGLAFETRRAADYLRAVAEGDLWLSMANALDALAMLPGVKIFRRELLWAAIDTLRDAGADPNARLSAALRRRRNLSSHIGRRLARCSVGTTLLVKGMEFDHAVVVHTGGPRGFTVNDLYVALTRGSSSLTVLALDDTIAIEALAQS